MRPVKRALFTAIAVLAALPAAAPAAVKSSHSGWRWGNPRPQGETLNTVEFAGARGYAAGQFGTLLRTDDGGRSWTGIDTGLTVPLVRVSLLTRDSFLVSSGCTLRRSDDGGATFRRLPFTASDRSCRGGVVATAFPSATSVLILLGNGNVLRSTDGGRTFARRTAIPGTTATSGSSSIAPTDMVFTSPTRGFATTDGGNVFTTPDAGSTWTPVADRPFGLRSITFPTPNVGYVVGDAPFALKTTDGGQSFTQSPLPDDVPSLISVRCADSDRCIGVTRLGDRLARTTDGGTTWGSLTVATRRIRAAAFSSPTRAVAVGDAGTTVLSDDSATTFGRVGAELPGEFTGIEARTAREAYAFGPGGALARTVNGGETWTEIDAATSDDLRDVSFLSRSRGFVLDVAGQLLRTDNAGESYAILNAGTQLRPQALTALGDRTVLLVGPVGVRRSTDSGETFRASASRRIRDASFFDVDRVGERVLAYGPRALRLSADAGRTWRAIRRPSRATRINVVDLVSARTAYLLDARGKLFRTDDLRRWREMPGLGTEVGYNVRFADRDNGWVAVGEFGEENAGYVLRTKDGGRTWEPQLLARARLDTDGLATPAPGVGFALLTQIDGLLTTRTGGSSGTRSTLRISSPTRRIRRRGDAVRIDGRLSPARGGERIVVSFRERGRSAWLFQEVTAASNGTFTVVARVRRTAAFVAQWAGDEDRRGAGTRVLRVRGR